MSVRAGSVLTAFALVVAACGGDDTVAPSNVGPTAPTSSATSTSAAPTSTEPAAPTSVAPVTPTTLGPTTPTPTTLAPTTPPTSAIPVTETTAITTEPDTDGVVLRPDGLGPFDFGTGNAEVEAWLTSALGPPAIVPTGGHAPVYACARWGCSESTLMFWPAANLHVAFAERTDSGEESPELLFAAWTVGAESWWPGRIFPLDTAWMPGAVDVRLMTRDGIGLGSSVAEIAAAVPTAGFLGWHDSAFQPTGFHTTDSAGRVALEGDVDWNPVPDMQSALNSSGAELVVDGIAGPATRAALADFQVRYDVAAPAAAFEALGITYPSPDAHVIRLSAGGWFWEFECGEMAIFGFDDPC